MLDRTSRTVTELASWVSPWMYMRTIDIVFKLLFSQMGQPCNHAYEMTGF